MTDQRGRIEVLAAEFWIWRNAQQPQTGDDVNRVPRPDGWSADWSKTAVERYESDLADFSRGWEACRPAEDDLMLVNDWRLIGSALARVEWELHRYPQWRLNPRFYVNASLGPIFQSLLRPPPFDDMRVAELVTLLQGISRILADAEQNIAVDAFIEFAELTVAQLADAGEQLVESMRAVAQLATAADGDKLVALARDATVAFDGYRRWVSESLSEFQPYRPLPREQHDYYAQHVSLSTYDPDEWSYLAQVEEERALWLELLERQSTRRSAMPPLPVDAAAQSAREAVDERAVRAYYESSGLLSQPSRLRHYLNAPMPDYLDPLRWLAVSHYTGHPNRPGDDAINYMREPASILSLIPWGKALDSRTGIAHEGVHAQQLAMAWTHPNPVRRHYYDSECVEGLAYYNEELMLRAGLFADAPHSRVAMCALLRLRALRVTVDVGLATGALSIDEAADLIVARAPEPPGYADAADVRAAARNEVITNFAETPLHSSTYQVGKTRITSMLADVQRARGDAFDLQEFHDYLWLNSQVPIALVRSELLSHADKAHTAHSPAAPLG